MDWESGEGRRSSDAIWGIGCAPVPATLACRLLHAPPTGRAASRVPRGLPLAVVHGRAAASPAAMAHGANWELRER